MLRAMLRRGRRTEESVDAVEKSDQGRRVLPERLGASGTCRVAVLGQDIDALKEFARWCLSFSCDAVREARAPAFEVLIEPEDGARARDVARAAAFAAEMIWGPAHCPALAHVEEEGAHALYGSHLVVDMRAGDEAARQRDLSFQVPFLCPQAVLVVHRAGASLASELDQALVSVAGEAPDAAADAL